MCYRDEGEFIDYFKYTYCSNLPNFLQHDPRIVYLVQFLSLLAVRCYTINQGWPNFFHWGPIKVIIKDPWAVFVGWSFTLYAFAVVFVSRICLRWTLSHTDTVVWTWLALGSWTPKTVKWLLSSKSGRWKDFRLRPNLTLVYWTASWLWVLSPEWLTICVQLTNLISDYLPSCLGGCLNLMLWSFLCLREQRLIHLTNVFFFTFHTYIYN